MESILVVDTSKTNLLYLSLILEKSGYRVFKASNGLDALTIYQEHNPNLVITELALPFLSGIDLVKKIRRMPQDVFSPIFVVTHAVSSQEIQNVLLAGADDFLQKPYSEQLFLAKVNSLLRMRTMQQDLNDTKKTIENIHANLELEHQSAERIFEKFVHGATKNIPGLETHISSASIFNGDVFLSTISPSGNVVLLLGDFTGHGLPAAIGAIPVAEVFYSMSRRGRTPAEIIRVMNDKLKDILPTHIFFGCILVHFNPEQQKLSVFNAGMQPAVRLNEKLGEVQLFESTAAPLGILASHEFSIEFQTIMVDECDDIVLFTDGVVEAMNPQNEMFGMDRLIDSLRQTPEHCLQQLVDDAEIFTEGVDIDDDVSIAKLSIRDVLSLSYETVNAIVENDVRAASRWKLNFEYTAQTLQNQHNPVEGVVDAIMVMQPLIAYKEELFMVLTELYNNALEHGLLSLDSAIKQQPNGFMSYQQQKQEKLEALDEGEICILVEQTPVTKHSAVIDICVQQSAHNIENFSAAEHDEQIFSGRGIKLVESLCESLTFNAEKAEVTARYRWKQTVYEA